MDTSLAIHPDNFASLEQEAWTDIGAVTECRRLDYGCLFRCEAGQAAVTFYDENTVRVTMNPRGGPEQMRDRHVLVKRPRPEAKAFEMEELPDRVVLRYGRLSATVRKHPLRITFRDEETGTELLSEGDRGMMHNAKGAVRGFKQMEEEDRFYGFGEKAGFLNKRGERLTMWNTDVYAPHNPETDPLYVSVPFYLTSRSGRCFGLFLFNTYRTEFDLTGTDQYCFTAEGGQLDYFLFAGPTPKDTVRQYADLTGRAPLPPRWALGYHQSRYSYASETEVRELVRQFRDKDIPLDAVYLDIHYMDGYRVFTFDRARFPDPERLIRELKAQGIRVVPIVDPGVKADPEYAVFREGVESDQFCKYADGQIFYGNVWPGKSAFPDFTDAKVREWWGGLHAYYADMGIEGIWNDMNEPSVFQESKTMDTEVMHRNDGFPATHRELHNQYGFFMSKATYEGLKLRLAGRRPFVVTRAGFAGVQRYAAVWTGDNRSFWEHLEMSIPMCLNLGLSGIPLCGADVGGFAHDSNGQLLVRWTQAGALMPFFRNHSELKSARQEPWVFGKQVEDLTAEAIRLRYRWMPYLYGLFVEASRTGLPVMRPLLMEFPEDPRAHAVTNQYMIGSQVIVAPVVRPDATCRLVYLPKGTWIDYHTGESHAGGRHIIAEAPIDRLPIFIRQGAIVPHAAPGKTEGPESLTVHLYPAPGQSSAYVYYEDDGTTFGYASGEAYEEEIRMDMMQEGVVNVHAKVLRRGFTPAWKIRRFVIHGDFRDLRAVWNGREVECRAESSGCSVQWVFEA